jgi:hypothetical protein
VQEETKILSEIALNDMAEIARDTCLSGRRCGALIDICHYGGPKLARQFSWEPVGYR